MEKMNFDEAMKRLETIVSKLDEQDLPLEESISLFEEGLKLSTQLQQLLQSYEKRIAQIIEEVSSEDAHENTN